MFINELIENTIKTIYDSRSLSKNIVVSESQKKKMKQQKRVELSGIIKDAFSIYYIQSPEIQSFSLCNMRMKKDLLERLLASGGTDDIKKFQQAMAEIVAASMQFIAKVEKAVIIVQQKCCGQLIFHNSFGTGIIKGFSDNDTIIVQLGPIKNGALTSSWGVGYLKREQISLAEEIVGRFARHKIYGTV
eukprot:UN30994